MRDDIDAFDAAHPGRDLDVRGVRLHYLDEGKGRPVVMVHGNPSWSYYYRRLAEALSAEYRVVVPDHVGCGRSEKPDDSRYEYKLSRRIDDLGALLDSLGLVDDITLVVHDWGGMIGMGYATRYPGRIARLVVLNTSAFRIPAGKAMPPELRAARLPLVGAALVRGLNLFCKGAARRGVTRRPMSPAVRDAYLAPYGCWADRIAVHRFVQDIPLRPGDRSYEEVLKIEGRLPTLSDVPMLVCWGMKDFVFDHHFLDEWARRFPNADVRRFEEAGHYVLEDEADRIVPLVKAFLAAVPAPSPSR